MGAPETEIYKPEYYGTVNLLYSPVHNDIIESLEYPNQIWHIDNEGKYRLYIESINPIVTHVKYYLIGTL